MKTFEDFIEWPLINTTTMTPHLAAWVSDAQKIIRLQNEALVKIAAEDNLTSRSLVKPYAYQCLVEISALIGEGK